MSTKLSKKPNRRQKAGQRRECDNLCGLGKRFFEGRLGHIVWVNNFSTVMNESRTWFIDKSFLSSSIPEMLLVGNSRLIERFSLIVCLGPERRTGLWKQQHHIPKLVSLDEGLVQHWFLHRHKTRRAVSTVMIRHNSSSQRWIGTSW